MSTHIYTAVDGHKNTHNIDNLHSMVITAECKHHYLSWQGVEMKRRRDLANRCRFIDAIN